MSKIKRLYYPISSGIWERQYTVCYAVLSCSVMSNSLQPHGLAPATPLGSSVHGHSPGKILEWVAMPSSKGFSNPGIKPRSPTLQVDSLPSEPTGKPKNTGVGSLPLLKGNFLTQVSKQGLLDCRWNSLPAELPAKPSQTIQFSSVAQSRSTLRLRGLQYSRLPCSSPTPGACLKLMSIKSVMPSNHLILCHPFLLQHTNL